MEVTRIYSFISNGSSNTIKTPDQQQKEMINQYFRDWMIPGGVV